MQMFPKVPLGPDLLRRVGATAVNAVEVLRHGGFETGDDYSPYKVVSSNRICKLRRYFPDDLPADAPVVLLVHPLMITGDLWDIDPRTSAVAALHAQDIDVWTIDFGRPEHEPGGLERTLTDHALAVSDAVDEVRAHTGRDVVLGGQSQGGMFSYQVAAYRRGDGIDSLITFGSPVDTRAPLGVPMAPETAATLARVWLWSGLARRISIPGWAMRGGTQMMTPVGVVKGKAQYYLNLHDRERLLPHERRRQYLEGQGWTSYSGPAFAELLEQFLVQNRMLEGGFVFRDRSVSLADIDVPILTVVGTKDLLGTPQSVRGIRRAAPRADVYELTLPIGHFGIIGGNTARRITWPTVAGWIRWRAGLDERPEAIVPAELIEDPGPVEPSTVRKVIGWTADTGVTVGARTVSTASEAIKSAQAVARAGVDHLPRLRDLGDLKPGTQISLGLLLDEAAKRAPESVVYAFGDRVIRHGEFKYRVDSIVNGMLSLGMRQGMRIGVLMNSRPSAFSTLAAISRLGATAVLLRPEGDLETEVRLGQIGWLISDPSNARDQALPGVTWCVLGVGGEDRELPAHVIDMERIDPAQVRVPRWYRANPRTASDIAFVLFTGDGAATRDILITNRRWALSALGAAQAAGLTASDTVYSVTPLYHSSAILHAMAGAIASGARLALAGEGAFWEEVRRYGATHVSYTWTSLQPIVDAPPSPGERNHPVRVFMGSGMPGGLWSRVAERFPGVRIVEVYASAEGDAILANRTGTKVGSVGRPLPGTPEVRVVEYGLASQRLVIDSDGYARETRPGAVGMLIVRGDGSVRRNAVPLRSVFEPGDSWLATGDLFTRDADGDLWPMGHASTLIQTPSGPVPPSVVSQALEAIPSVGLAAAYGVGSGEIVGAITPLPGARVSAADLGRAVSTLPPEQRPAYVQSLEIPLTAWSRPRIGPLRDAGLPRPAGDRTVWKLGANGKTYSVQRTRRQTP
ncbi:AMP-binding protein [Kribbella sp. NPDC051137]|uniref:AMP-binding protein n=1 Tax=Kribbella sp. NPDC051137 TaxID=3155045 RepID=UPI003441121E